MRNTSQRQGALQNFSRGIDQAIRDSGLTQVGHTGELQTPLLISGRGLFPMALGQEWRVGALLYLPGKVRTRASSTLASLAGIICREAGEMSWWSLLT